MAILTFDVGGSFIRAGWFDSTSESVDDIHRCPTPNYLSHPQLNAEALLTEVYRSIRDVGFEVTDDTDPDIVVIGYPGPITESGVALRAPTILGEALDCEHDVKSAVQKIWPEAPICVLNDLSCSGYSYTANGHRDFCVITVGSGIGNKVFLSGMPVTGVGGRGGEVGHLQVSPGAGPPPLTDELGNIASGRGTVELARRWLDMEPADPGSPLGRHAAAGRPVDSAQLVGAFRRGDERAVRIVAAASHPLASAIGMIHLSIGIESFFIVGGFAKALGPRYIELIVATLQEITWDLDQDWASMVELGDMDVEEALLGGGFFGRQTLMQLMSSQRRGTQRA